MRRYSIDDLDLDISIDTQAVLEESGNLLRALLLTGLVLVVFVAISMLLYRVILPRLEKRLDPQRHAVAAILIKGFKRPVAAYLKVACVLCMLLTLATWLPTHLLPATILRFLTWVPNVITKALRICAVVAVTWGLVASSDITSLVMRKARSGLDLHMGKSVTQFLSAIFKLVVIAVAAVVLLSEFGYDINGLVAGLGLGGLTVALAAQKTAADFFGGLTIVLEKPFEIGDWISCSVVEGTVEEINLRATRIRTSDGSLTTVPNSTISDEAITNWSGVMRRRRANFRLQLTYSTDSASIQGLCEAIKALLKKEPDIEDDSFIVRFTDIADSSLNLTVIFYSKKPGYGDFLEIKERVNYAILELAKQNKAEFAYPSTSVYIEKE